MAAIAKSLSALNAEQLLNLFSMLLEGRRGACDRPKASTADADVQTRSVQQPAPPQKTADRPADAIEAPTRSHRHRRPFFAAAARVARLFLSVRVVAKDPDVWKPALSNMIPWLIGLAVAPIVVQYSFDRDRAAAKARLSIEYAFLSAYSPPLAGDANELVARISRHPLYMEYARARAMSGRPFNLTIYSMHGVGLSSPMREKLLAETATFGDELRRSKAKFMTQKSSLPTLGVNELRTLAFRVMENQLPTDNSVLRETLSRALDEKVSEVDTLATAVSDLQALVGNSNSGILVRLTILNRGATDGLVRHKGWVDYRGTAHEMTRVAPPSANPSALAVPVFQTNQADSDFAPQSVGKVAQDSMAEFWYHFSTGKAAALSATKLCMPGEHLKVTLHDQNDIAVVGRLDCNQEEN